MPNVVRLIDANNRRFAAMRFHSDRINEFKTAAEYLLAPAHKARYQEISRGVWGKPDYWGVVAVAHWRESSGHFSTYLGNGQLLGQVTTIEPKGRGPFFDHDTDPPLRDAFYRGALDALIDVQHADRWVRTYGSSPGSLLTFLESLNGYGYADGPSGHPPMASPYIWGGTSEQQIGKYPRDHFFDPNAWDSQLGCAGLLRYMTGLDPSVGFGPPASVPSVPIVPPAPPIIVPTPAPVPVPVPAPTPEPPVVTPPAPVPAQPDWAAMLLNLGKSMLPQLLPVLLPLVPKVLASTPLAGLAPIADILANVVVKAQPLGGVTALPPSAIWKLIADEGYRVCISIDPSLPHGPNA
jgi:lysozyme family protein